MLSAELVRIHCDVDRSENSLTDGNTGLIPQTKRECDGIAGGFRIPKRGLIVDEFVLIDYFYNSIILLAAEMTVQPTAVKAVSRFIF
jgi:hypothetical protein